MFQYLFLCVILPCFDNFFVLLLLFLFIYNFYLFICDLLFSFLMYPSNMSSYIIFTLPFFAVTFALFDEIKTCIFLCWSPLLLCYSLFLCVYHISLFILFWIIYYLCRLENDLYLLFIFLSLPSIVFALFRFVVFIVEYKILHSLCLFLCFLS